MTRQISVSAFLLAATVSFGQPTITRQPVEQSVSLGATVTNLVAASGALPLLFP